MHIQDAVPGAVPGFNRSRGTNPTAVLIEPKWCWTRQEKGQVILKPGICVTHHEPHIHSCLFILSNTKVNIIFVPLRRQKDPNRTIMYMHPKVVNECCIKREGPWRDITFTAEQHCKEVAFELNNRSGRNFQG